MKKELLYGVSGLLVGLLIAGVTATLAVNNNNERIMGMMGMHASGTNNMMSDEDMSISQMTASLQDKTGDDFDKNFISMMIAHHQGAIDMAKLAQKNAKHEEIKNMAGDIITTQSKEIDMMQTWQGDWGYKTTTTMQMGH